MIKLIIYVIMQYAATIADTGATVAEQSENTATKVEEVYEEEAEADTDADEIVHATAQAWDTYEATAYTAFCDTGCIGITATGHDVSERTHVNGRRVIAVDPTTIPLHSIVEVRTQDGHTFEAIALDTGGAIKGHRIDILMDTKEEANIFGRQAVNVRIIRSGAD